MYKLNGLCGAEFHTPIVSEIPRSEFVSTVQCALGLRLLYSVVKNGGVPQSKWLPFADVVIIPFRF
jgi:hypothetical protein